MECPNCNGSGKCPQCIGSGKITCNTCNGAGTLTTSCSTCGGTGSLADGTQCPVCAGTGQVSSTCPICNGQGSFPCIQCNGTGVCKICLGTGQVNSDLGLLLSVIKGEASALPNPGHFLRALTNVNYDEVNIPAEIAARAQVPIWYVGVDLKDIVATFDEDVTYGPVKNSLFPPEVVYTATNENDTSVQNSQSLNVGQLVSTSDSVAITFTEGVAGGTNFGINIGIPGKLGISFGEHTGFSFTQSTVQTTSKSQSRSWNYQILIPVAPHKTVRTELIYSKSLVSCSFDGTVRFRGAVHFRSKPMLIGPVIVRTGPEPVEPVGVIFRRLPHPRVTVISDTEITCKVSGTFDGIIGVDMKTKSEEIGPVTNH